MDAGARPRNWGVVGVVEGVRERSYVRLSLDRGDDEASTSRVGLVLLRQGAVTSFGRIRTTSSARRAAGAPGGQRISTVGR